MGSLVQYLAKNIGNEKQIYVLHLFNRNKGAFLHARQKNHPSFLHENSTLFGIGEVLIVFGNLLKEELLSLIIFGDWGIVVFNQLESTKTRLEQFILFPEDGILCKDVLSTPTMSKKQMLVELANSPRDWGIRFPSMLSRFMFLTIHPSTSIAKTILDVLLGSTLLLKRDRGIIWSVKYHKWRLKAINVAFVPVSLVVQNAFGSCSNQTARLSHLEPETKRQNRENSQMVVAYRAVSQNCFLNRNMKREYRHFAIQRPWWIGPSLGNFTPRPGVPSTKISTNLKKAW